MWLLGIFLLAAEPVGLSPAEAFKVAALDSAKHQPQDLPYIRYIHLPAQTREQQSGLSATLAFVISSSSRATNLDAQLPRAVGDGLYRIDLRELKWDPILFNKGTAHPHNPYTDQHVPLVIRGDWLVEQLSDGTRSQLYYDLLYGDKVPKNRDEFLAFWKVDRKKDAEFSLGLVEGQSGVSLQKIRWIESFPQPDARMWGTRDFLRLEKGKDPLKQPDGGFKHDAEEWIGSIPKVSYKLNSRGHAQAYLLSDQNGKIVQEAPGRIVEDSTRAFNHAVIINPGSCHSCHPTGLNSPSVNEIRRMLKEGIEIFEYNKERQEFIERFHLTDLDKHISRHNEDFALYVEAATGRPPTENAKLYQQALKGYLADVTLAQAGCELGVSGAVVKNAIAAASDRGIHVGAHPARLVHGIPMPRPQWEEYYLAVRSYVEHWQGAIRK